MIPEFAIMGHPNEGKSSVLSTLAEDDSVRVSATPGETRQCRTFPVVIDGKEILRFTDTPGFQNPGQILSELRKSVTHTSDPLGEVRRYAENIPELHDDCELLAPLERGAGIIYVVDGSRPVRNVDRAEMEILRLSGKPRMAIINCKVDDDNFLQEWKNEFRKNFNSNRVFNAHRATYAERIELLEALKSIDQDWQQPLTEVVTAFKSDWAARNQAATEIISSLVYDGLSLQISEPLHSEDSIATQQEKMLNRYRKKLSTMEELAHGRLRTLYKHNIFNYELPTHSILREDLFNERGWELLGLTKKQLVIVGGLGGATIGAGLDVAALGHGLGLFTVVGGVAGALGAIFGGENLSSKSKGIGLPIGGETVQIGPAKSIDLLLVLLNRSLLYYEHIINWAHGKRDYSENSGSISSEMAGHSYTKSWSTKKIKRCHEYFKAIKEKKIDTRPKANTEFRRLILETLQEISESKDNGSTF